MPPVPRRLLRLRLGKCPRPSSALSLRTTSSSASITRPETIASRGEATPAQAARCPDPWWCTCTYARTRLLTPTPGSSKFGSLGFRPIAAVQEPESSQPLLSSRRCGPGYRNRDVAIAVDQAPEPPSKASAAGAAEPTLHMQPVESPRSAGALLRRSAGDPRPHRDTAGIAAPARPALSGSKPRPDARAGRLLPVTDGAVCRTSAARLPGLCPGRAAREASGGRPDRPRKSTVAAFPNVISARLVRCRSRSVR